MQHRAIGWQAAGQIYFFVKQAKDCAATPAHGCIFRAQLVEVFFRLLQPRMLFKNRRLKIVQQLFFPLGQRLPDDFFDNRFCRRLWQTQAAKSLPCVYMNARCYQHQLVASKIKVNRLKNFTASGGVAGFVVNEKWAVAAELQGITLQLLAAETKLVFAVEHLQHTCSIGRASAQAGTHGYVFEQMNLYGRQVREIIFQNLPCFNTKIVGRITLYRKAVIVDVWLLFIGQGHNFQRIFQRYGIKHSGNIMIAVIAFLQYLQAKIDFAIGKY